MSITYVTLCFLILRKYWGRCDGEMQVQSMAGRGSGEQEQERGDEHARSLALRHRLSPAAGGESFGRSLVAVLRLLADVLLRGADS